MISPKLKEIFQQNKPIEKQLHKNKARLDVDYSFS